MRRGSCHRPRRSARDVLVRRVSASEGSHLGRLLGAVREAVAGVRAHDGDRGRDGLRFIAGNRAQTIAAQLARGVPADVVILSREGLTELIGAKRIAAGTAVDLAQTPIGVAVRAGAAKPDVSTVDAFKRVLLAAKSIAVPSSTSGIFLMNDVFPRLGIAQKINVKPTPRGKGAAAMVASGEADIAVMPVSEIMHAPGVDFAGVIAEEIQLHQVFAAAVVAGSKEVDGARRLIAFLASEAAAATIRSSGMEPLGKRH